METCHRNGAEFWASVLSLLVHVVTKILGTLSLTVLDIAKCSGICEALRRNGAELGIVSQWETRKALNHNGGDIFFNFSIDWSIFVNFDMFTILTNCNEKK